MRILDGIAGRGQWVGRPNLARQASFAGIARGCGILLTACGALLWLASPASAEVVQPALVQTIDTSAYSPSSPDPAGIAYMPAQDRLLISDSEVNETGLYQGSNLFTATRTGSGFGSGTTLAYSQEPSGLGYNPSDGTLYVADDDKDRIYRVQPGPDGVHGTADDAVSNFRTSVFGSGDPEGVEYDPATGRVLVCDGADIDIYTVDPVNGTFGDGNDAVTNFDLARYGARDCEGLGLDASRNALLAVDWRTDAIYEVSMGGALLRTLDLSAIPTSSSLVAGVTMAPSSNPNDSPSAMNYWIVDRHRDNQSATPPPVDGLLYEMTLGESGPPPPPPPPFFNLPISSGANDADETQGGTVNRNTGDIELGTGSSAPATAALRFTGVQIPNGATIANAQVQFRADETGKKVTNLTIRAERADNSAPIATTNFNITSRTRTTASVTWVPPAWQTVGAAGSGQLTPNLASVVQEVVDRPGWAAGNALTVIFNGTGRRTAESFEGGSPPVLRVTFVLP